MDRNRLYVLSVFAILLVFISGTQAWWEKTHQLVSRQAIMLLPAPLREFYGRYEGEIIAHAGDSDKWKRVKPHTYDWLDLEVISVYPFDDIPADRTAAEKKYGKEILEKKAGVLPWNAAEEYHNLVRAFKGGDDAALIRNATHLSHHLADAHMPFHATVNFDGQPVGNKRVHGRIEGALENRLAQVQLADSGAVRFIKEPFSELVRVLRTSNGRVFQLLYWDAMGCKMYFKDGQPQEGDAGYESFVMEKLGRLFTLCLDEAALMIACFWYTAWQEAGTPTLIHKKVKIKWEVDQPPYASPKK